MAMSFFYGYLSLKILKIQDIDIQPTTYRPPQ
jgi:hypothetical protein